MASRISSRSGARPPTATVTPGRRAARLRADDRPHHAGARRGPEHSTSTTTRPTSRTHLEKLMGRYATRQVEVDRLFRGGRLVDLYRWSGRAFARRSRATRSSAWNRCMASSASSSFEMPDRRSPSSSAGCASVASPATQQDTLDLIERYNRDDVVSTWLLRDWLEAQRTALGASLGEVLPRPILEEGAAARRSG